MKDYKKIKKYIISNGVSQGEEYIILETNINGKTIDAVIEFDDKKHKIRIEEIKVFEETEKKIKKEELLKEIIRMYKKKEGIRHDKEKCNFYKKVQEAISFDE